MSDLEPAGSKSNVTKVDAIYRQIGRQYVLNYAAGTSKKRKKIPNCRQGWNCGYSCQSKEKENCESPLKGQAKTYTDWLSRQAKISQKKPDGQRNEFAQSWSKSWENAPDDLKEVLRILDDPQKYSLPSKEIFYTKGQVSMGDATPDSAFGRSAWRHEVGHYIDEELRNVPSRGRSVDWLESRPYFSSGENHNAARINDQEALLNEVQAIKSRLQDVEPPVIKTNDGEDALQRNSYAYRREIATKEAVGASIKSGKTVSEEISRIIDSRFDELPDDILAKKLFNKIPDKVKDDMQDFLVENMKTEILADPNFSLTIAKLADLAFGGKHEPTVDLLGATTLNRIGHGHSMDYYLNRGVAGQNTEAFANITSLYGTGDPIAVEVLERLVPNQFKLYKQALSEAIGND